MKLDAHTHVNEKESPELFAWDKVYRKNYAFYQDLIDSLTFHVQKTKRGIITSKLYPCFFQKDLMTLQIYKLKQQLGEIDTKEIEIYGRNENLNISKSLYQTFNAGFTYPVKGAVAGVFGIGIGNYCNFHYGYRAIFFFAPVFAQIAFNFYKRSVYNIESIEFMNWAIQFRAAKAKLENKNGKLPDYLVKKYKHYVKSEETSFKLYEDLLNEIEAAHKIIEEEQK